MSKSDFLSLLEDKLLPGLQYGLLRSEENIILNNFQHLRFMGVGVSCNIFMDDVVNDDHTALAVVIDIVLLAYIIP